MPSQNLRPGFGIQRRFIGLRLRIYQHSYTYGTGRLTEANDAQQDCQEPAGRPDFYPNDGPARHVRQVVKEVQKRRPVHAGIPHRAHCV